MDLRLFVVHSALLLSSVYSARILEEFHLIRLDLSPTYLLFNYTETGYSLIPILITVRINNFDKLPCIINVYDFVVSTEHIDLQSTL